MLMTLNKRLAMAIRSDFSCLSRVDRITSALRDVTPFDLGIAVSHVRHLLSSLKFEEVLLGPFALHPIDYLNNQIDVPGVGQLRFNTEPEIWESSRHADRFFSVTTLFRRENVINPLRRSAFFIVDFYQIGAPESLMPVFRRILAELGKAGHTSRLSRLRIDEGEYDPGIDGPKCDSHEARWLVTKGYDAEHSFFEVDKNGKSTRREIFLVTPFGYLEIGVLGITGLNRNPRYVVRTSAPGMPAPDFRRCGMCFGLERLLLAEQILSIAEDWAR